MPKHLVHSSEATLANLSFISKIYSTEYMWLYKFKDSPKIPNTLMLTLNNHLGSVVILIYLNTHVNLKFYILYHVLNDLDCKKPIISRETYK